MVDGSVNHTLIVGNGFRLTVSFILVSLSRILVLLLASMCRSH